MDLSGGSSDEPGREPSGFGLAGLNFGAPLWRDWHLGIQAGAGMAERRNGNSEAAITSGLFVRDLALVPGANVGMALLSDLLRTAEDARILSLRGITGTTIKERDHVGVSGVLPANWSAERGPDSSRGQERFIARSDVFWGHDFGENVAAEVSCGYQFGEVGALVLGARGSALLFSNLYLAPEAEWNLDRDYAFGISIVYEMVTHKFAPGPHRFESQGRNDYTPFRKLSSSELLVERRR